MLKYQLQKSVPGNSDKFEVFMNIESPRGGVSREDALSCLSKYANQFTGDHFRLLRIDGDSVTMIAWVGDIA